MTDEINKAYARGYSAGRRRQKADKQERNAERRKREFYNRALLAALPACMDAANWTTGKGEAITTLTQRVKLADNAAEEALRYFRG